MAPLSTEVAIMATGRHCGFAWMKRYGAVENGFRASAGVVVVLFAGRRGVGQRTGLDQGRCTRTVHVAGGVHATVEPVQTLDAGWDVAAVGEGETTTLRLVDASGDPLGVAGLAFRDSTGTVVKTGRNVRQPRDEFCGSSLRWGRFNALEITRGCAFACAQ
jgi:radical SAM superfamily enzyme YgiQ (UPF0313 family)